MPEIDIIAGDNRVSLRRLIDDGVRVHSVVTDPPYGLVSVQKRFGKEGAAAARTEGNDGSFARLSGGFMGKCFHPDTEVLTDRGWKNVGDVSVGEIVATLNPKTRNLEWQVVEQTHCYPFDGELVHIDHRSAEQMITPNHRMLVSNDGGESLTLLQPSELKAHFHMFAQANPVYGITDKVTITSERDYGKDRAETRSETERFNADAFFRFFGIWLGDGYTCCRTNNHPANDFFGIAVKKERKVVAIRQALIDLGIRFTETATEGGGYTNFYCYNFALLGWLKALGGAREKFIPTWLFQWDASHLEHLYTGLIDTDGTVQGADGQEVFYTSSKQLADDFQRLCLHTGRSASVKLNPGGKSVEILGNTSISSDAWVCCVLQPGKRMYGEKSLSRSNVVFEVQFTGDVVCIGVREHHIIYTRFNGKPVWTGNSWDGTGIERDPEFWHLIWEILLPGGYVFAFSGSRTGHWQACAMEQAGFVMHPMHGWVFGSGFPKAHAADKAIDKMLGVDGNYSGVKPGYEGHYGKDNLRSLRESGTMSQDGGFSRPWMSDPEAILRKQQQYQAGSIEAAEWEGWAYGTQAQKPALEPIYLGQKPFSEKTGAANLLKHGVGAVNIDGCRVPGIVNSNPLVRNASGGYGSTGLVQGVTGMGTISEGRHPANLIHDGSAEVIELFPDSKGQQGAVRGDEPSGVTKDIYGKFNGRVPAPVRGDSGSAARFFHAFPPDTDPIFYHPKAGKLDRAGSKHPTVKPVALMQYLIRHITPPGGIVLDPFAGSGTTAEAARREGFDCLLMEAEPEYVEFLRNRFGGTAETTDQIDFNEELMSLLG